MPAAAGEGWTMAGTVLAVHGAGGGGWEWELWAPVLAARGWHLRAPDLVPGPSGLAGTGFHDYLGQVERAALAVAGPAVLVGASLGGLLVLAASARVRPAALVLVNALPPAGVAPGMPPRPWPPVVPWSRSPLAGTVADLPDADLASARWAHRRWRDESGAVLGQAQAGIAVARPDCPLLVLAAELDRDVPPALSRALAGYLGGDLAHVAGCGHLGILLGDRAAAAATLVAAWLDARVPAGNRA
jgi:pimeloyl-ACP methyl ester carboxylesterase